MKKEKDLFGNKAKTYEKEKNRVNNVSNIAEKILSEINYKEDMKLMDFGAGTGLLLSHIAPYVKEITAVDLSDSMIEQLKEKIDEISCDVKIVKKDLSKESLNEKFDGIISSMTIHHIQNLESIFNRFYGLLKDNGSIALADLDLEDGTFHKEDTGVFHFGFDRDEFRHLAEIAGFRNIKIQTVGKVIKPHGEYSVFLLTANK